MSMLMKKTIFHIIAISALFLISVFILFHRQEDRLMAKNEIRLCLNAETSKQDFEKILVNNAYAATAEDAALISEWLIDSCFIKEGKILDSLDFILTHNLYEEEEEEIFDTELLYKIFNLEFIFQSKGYNHKLYMKVILDLFKI